MTTAASASTHSIYTYCRHNGGAHSWHALNAKVIYEIGSVRTKRFNIRARASETLKYSVWVSPPRRGLYDEGDRRECGSAPSMPHGLENHPPPPLFWPGLGHLSRAREPADGGDSSGQRSCGAQQRQAVQVDGESQRYAAARAVGRARERQPTPVQRPLGGRVCH
eukprot:4434088-Pleurochrysis_carterae.AAC.2